MKWPHSPDFRGVPTVLFWFATIVGALAMFVPGVLGWMRWFSIPLAYLMLGAGFGGGWVLAHFFRFVLGSLSPSFAFKFALFYFYGLLVATLLTPLAVALDPALEAPEIHALILSMPAMLGFCAGIRYVLNQHAIAV